MISQQAEAKFWAGMTLRESLTACLSSALIIVSAVFFRIPLHLPGHRVLPLVFFLLLGRCAIAAGWAGTAMGSLAGLALFGMGQENPAHVAQYVGIGLIADVIWLVCARGRAIWLGTIAGALMGAGWIPIPLLINRMLGMDRESAIWIALMKNGSAVAFGALAGALAFFMAKRLRTAGILLPR
jgi:hypothetical protein